MPLALMVDNEMTPGVVAVVVLVAPVAVTTLYEALTPGNVSDGSTVTRTLPAKVAPTPVFKVPNPELLIDTLVIALEVSVSPPFTFKEK